MTELLKQVVMKWGAAEHPTLLGMLWKGALLSVLLWLDGLRDGAFLVPPFAATMAILLYLPGVAIAQPFAVVVGSTFGAAIGTVLSMILGIGPFVAVLAALVAVVVLPWLRAFHPPGVALAMYPALLNPGTWFALQVVLPFTIAAVISAAIMSRLAPGWPQYPVPVGLESGK